MTGYPAEPRPLRKVHSQAHADAYVASGWRLRTEFRAGGDNQPYEYVLVWEAEGQPVDPTFVRK